MSALSDLFTDIATAIREKTGDTEKMAPLAFPDAIRGIEAGSISRITIMPLTTLDDFALDTETDTTMYASYTPVSVSQIEVGSEYVVAFDGTKYTCTAVEIDENTIALGNLYIVSSEMEDTGESFLMVYDVATSCITTATNSEGESHTFAIYQESDTGSSGGGSGSADADAYWTVNQNLPKNFNNWAFIFNDELYVNTYTSSSTTALYKYADGAWTEVESTNALTDLLSNTTIYPSYVCFHDKLYVFCSTGGKCMYVWDSSTATWESVTLSSSIMDSCNGGCVYNDELYILRSKSLYKMNEDDYSLELVCSLDKSSGYQIFTVNGEMCVWYNNIIYKFNGTEFELLADLTAYGVTEASYSVSSNWVTVHGDCVYFVTNYLYLCKYNVVTDTVTFVGYVPFYNAGGYSHLVSYDGDLHIIGTGHASNYYKWLTLHDNT